MNDKQLIALMAASIFAAKRLADPLAEFHNITNLMDDCIREAAVLNGRVGVVILDERFRRG